MPKRTLETRLEVLVKEDQKYFEQLGRFIETFAHTELGLFYLLVIHYLKIELAIANTVFSGQRTEAIMGFIRRIWIAKSSSKKEIAELEEAFQHLTAINTLRNQIIHYSSNLYENEGRIVTNAPRAMPTQIREYRVSPELLSSLPSDCIKISAHFQKYFSPALAEITNAGLIDRAWKYKLPLGQQNQGRKGSRKKKL